MKLIPVLTFACIFLTYSLWSQNENGHFLVEFEAFSPPEKELIASLEDTRATPFLAPDVSGTERYLGDYLGKTVILWFWSMADNTSNDQIEQLNTIQLKYRDDLQVLSLANEKKEELLDFLKLNPLEFPVIPNGQILGEAAYGGDLGDGRVFLIDATGVIRKVMPRNTFEQNPTEAFQIVEQIIRDL